MANKYVVTSGAVFALVAILQALRAVEQVPVTVGSFAVPVAASWQRRSSQLLWRCGHSGQRAKGVAHNKALQTDVRDDERAGRRMGMDGAAGARRVADAHDAYEFVLQFHPIHVRHGEQRIRTRRARCVTQHRRRSPA